VKENEGKLRRQVRVTNGKFKREKEQRTRRLAFANHAAERTEKRNNMTKTLLLHVKNIDDNRAAQTNILLNDC
jgi:hypothetical protein